MRQRDDFWSSRVEGNVHMWQNIRSAAEALASDDVMLANAILEVLFFFFFHWDRSLCVMFLHRAWACLKIASISFALVCPCWYISCVHTFCLCPCYFHLVHFPLILVPISSPFSSPGLSHCFSHWLHGNPLRRARRPVQTADFYLLQPCWAGRGKCTRGSASQSRSGGGAQCEHQWQRGVEQIRHGHAGGACGAIAAEDSNQPR